MSERKSTQIELSADYESREQPIKIQETTRAELETMFLTFLGEESKSMWLTVIPIKYFSNISEALIKISQYSPNLF